MNLNWNFHNLTLCCFNLDFLKESNNLPRVGHWTDSVDQVWCQNLSFENWAELHQVLLELYQPRYITVWSEKVSQPLPWNGLLCKYTPTLPFRSKNKNLIIITIFYLKCKIIAPNPKDLDIVLK